MMVRKVKHMLEERICNKEKVDTITLKNIKGRSLIPLYVD